MIHGVLDPSSASMLSESESSELAGHKSPWVLCRFGGRGEEGVEVLAAAA
jgi:hypothetical protein